MKSLKIVALIAIAMLLASAVFAMHHTPEDRGKTLFNDPKLGGGTSGKSCATCHPDGKGLEGVGSKTMWKNPGGEFKSLEEAVNVCITMANKGTALDVNSEQMKDLVAYLKSLKPKAEKTHKSKAAAGC
jgi:mono/diheme cytochrome c family protein